MGDQLALFNEKQYSYSGYFDIKEIYEDLVEFLEGRNYHVVEKDYSESNIDKREITSVLEAKKHYSEVYEIVLKLKLTMSGVEEDVQINEKLIKSMTKGSAKIVINAYLNFHDYAIKPHSPFSVFLIRVYNFFFRQDELGKAKETANNDVNMLLKKFKEQVNSVLK
jgi:hypothetical protein